MTSGKTTDREEAL